MVRDINHDQFFLRQPSEPATPADIPVGQDLLDTLKAHKDECVGMAANMIGIPKNIIVVNMGAVDIVMFNPVIRRKTGVFETEEGCLSIPGTRKTKRYRDIEVEYQDVSFKRHRRRFSGWTAQIIQHEVDHLSGILI